MGNVEGLLQQNPSGFTILGAILLLLVLYLFYSGSWSDVRKTEPPGPRPLPLLGNMLQLDLKRPYRTLCELSKKYGSVFTVHFGPKKVVVLAGYKTVKDALVNHAQDFGDRDITPMFYDLNKGHGILFSNGESWKEMRRFALTNLRDFGMGKHGAEEKVLEEIPQLIEVFEKFGGKAFDPTQTVNYAASNIISSIVYGSRFEYDDPQFLGLVDRNNENVRLLGSASIQVYNMFPWLGPWLKNWRRIMKNVAVNKNEVMDLARGLGETLNPQMCRGFVDSFLVRKQTQEDAFTVDSWYHEDNLVCSVFNLFGAGTDTTSTTIRWGLLLMAKYPCIQDLVQEEISRVTGSRQPLVEDRKNLPYTDAVIHETQSSSSEELGINPPGPRPLPLLGNLHIIDLKRPYKTLYELSKTYGSVFAVHFGPRKAIVLAGYKTMKEALVTRAEDFGDRDVTPMLNDFCQGHGILFANGDSWREMRRFALANLRMGKKSAEEKSLVEIAYLIEEFKKHQGKPFDPTKPVVSAISNIISTFVFGQRFEYTDSFFTSMADRVDENLRLASSVSIQIYNIFPWLGPWIKNLKQIKMNAANIKADVMEIVGGLKETLNPEMSRGYVDSFLVRKQSLEESGKRDSLYHNGNLVFSISNLFTAGTDTSATTICWGLLLMAKYPKIQGLVQEEISRVTGSRQPFLEDRKNLPYTDAVIHETQRFANIVPMSVPHATSRDITFQGYFIKKGTTVIPLLTSVLHDEGEWENPHTFNPSHFLDEQGRFVKKEAFMPFSAGRRTCLGESLARMELFLFFTSLMQHFRFSPPPGVTGDDLDLTPDLRFIHSPLPHQLCAVSRV
ncbi:hypothetical protein DPEC_G00309050 [Dallia pectoralis]|uniref:Uncharacterized protein n=1 Tax=Dallia pectoralis TaxID=75939 RepID=A0ACC2FEW4_DALPE|nr:hypothetical protein DPEC_G00309050 [Dallia pectoralis]